jgi:translation elongation factor EF-1alpha
MAELKVGTITHFFSKINVGVLDIEDEALEVGDTIKIVGRGEEFEQEVTSIQVEHDAIERAEPGMSVGLKIKEGEQVKEGDEVFKVQ